METTATNLRSANRKSHISIVQYAHPSFVALLLKPIRDTFYKVEPVLQMLFGVRLTAAMRNYAVAPLRSTALTADMSAGGMGILVTEPIKAGKELVVFQRGFGQRPVPVTVRWCAKDSENFYRVGLMYS